MATSSGEGIGKKEGASVALVLRECFSVVELRAGNGNNNVVGWGVPTRLTSLCQFGNFLTQLVRETFKSGILLDLLFANREGPWRDVEVGSCLGQNNHEILYSW